MNECWHLVNDGVLNAKDVDTVMSEGLGMRYAFLGPLETAHLNAEGMTFYLFYWILNDLMYSTILLLINKIIYILTETKDLMVLSSRDFDVCIHYFCRNIGPKVLSLLILIP